MYRIDTANAAVAMPAPLGAGVMGYFQDTGPVTDLSADWFNMIQEELVYCLTMRGGTLDKADYHQLWDEVLLAEQVVKSAVADTGNVSTDVAMMVAAATTSRANGAASAAIATDQCQAGTAKSAILASAVVTATGTGSEQFAAASNTSAISGVAKTNQVILGSTHSSAVTETRGGVYNSRGSTASGDKSEVHASYDCAASNTQSMVAASDGSASACTASGPQSAVIASENACVASGEDAVTLASSQGCDAQGDQSAVVASTSACLATGGQAACLATSAGSVASGTPSACVATNEGRASAAETLSAAAVDNAVSGVRSAGIAGQGYELNDTDTIGGGFNAGALTPSGANQNLTWKIDASTGDAYLAGDLEVGGNVNTEAGATITLTGSTGAVLGALMRITAIKSGASRAAAGAAADEIWMAIGHATLIDRTLTIGG